MAGNSICILDEGFSWALWVQPNAHLCVSSKGVPAFSIEHIEPSDTWNADLRVI